MPRGVYPHISERVWQTHVERIARTLGYRLYHTWTSVHSAAGFPDLVLVRPGVLDEDGCELRLGRVVFAELKTLGKDPTAPQQAWLDALAAAGADVHVWRPGDEQHVADVLA